MSGVPNEAERHPNDAAVTRKQLKQSSVRMTEDERAALIASIDRQLAEIDARNAKP